MSYLKEYCQTLGLPLSFIFNYQKALYLVPHLISFSSEDIPGLIFKLDVRCLSLYNDVVVGGNYIRSGDSYVSKEFELYPELLDIKPLAQSDILRAHELELIKDLSKRDIVIDFSSDTITTVDIIESLDLSNGIGIMQAALEERNLINAIASSKTKQFQAPHSTF